MKSKEEILEILKKADLFSLFTDEDFEIILPLFEEEEFPAGTVIFNDGDFGDKYYIILEGEVRISKLIPRVGEETLIVMKKGDSFGEMALINDAPRSATAIANTKVVLFGMNRDSFDELIYFHKDQGYKVLLCFTRILGERLKATDERLAAFVSLSLSFGGPINDKKTNN